MLESPLFMQKLYVQFFIAALFLIVFVVWRDDDAGKFPPARKPTSNEGLARVRYVLAKTATALYLSGVMTYYLSIFGRRYNEYMSKIEIEAAIIIFIIIAFLLIRFVQNIFRIITKRAPAPYFDIKTFSHNIRRWRQFGRFD